MAKSSSKDNTREKAVDVAVNQIEKQFGRGSIMRLGDDTVKVDADTIPTGTLSLDAALGIGGMPRGRVVELFGPESSGKTTLALSVVAEAQKIGGYAAYIDAEHALDAVYARKMGVDVDNLLISQPDCGEDALEITDTLIRSGAIDVIVIDSVAALVPRAELEGEMGDAHVGLQARLMSQALRKLTGHISRSRTTVIFINQIRMKIGVMFGNPETTTGGKALKFYTSTRLEVRRVENITEGTADNVIGIKSRIKAVKNKVGPPFRKTEINIYFDNGIDTMSSYVDFAVQYKIIEKAASWFTVNGERLQGKSNVVQYFKDNPEVFNDIKEKVDTQLNPTNINGEKEIKEENEEEADNTK